MSDTPHGPILHERLVDVRTRQPARRIEAILRKSAERDASEIAAMLTRAYAEGLRDGYVQGVTERDLPAFPDNPETGDTT